MKKVTLSIIVAASRNGVIGNNNRLPWHLPEDLRYFKAVTLGKPVIMGRKTFESIGRSLPKRPNIVVTRDLKWSADSVLVAHDLIDAINQAKKVLMEQDNSVMEAMIIGGAEIYNQSLAFVDKVYLTRVNADIDGDAWFPELSPDDWELAVVTRGQESASLDYEFRIYERKKELVNN